MQTHLAHHSPLKGPWRASAAAMQGSAAQLNPAGPLGGSPSGHTLGSEGRSLAATADSRAYSTDFLRRALISTVLSVAPARVHRLADT